MDDAPSIPAAPTTVPTQPSAAPRPDFLGLGGTIAAFLIWGLLPLYLRPLARVSPLEIMSHRVVWSCVLVCAWLTLRGGLPALYRALTTSSTRNRLLLSATLVSVNWLGFVWAASVGRVLDASLGYFINPLVNVLLGVLLLQERLSRLRWVAVGLALLGVVWLAVASGAPPWIALLLAFSFSAYGLIRKLAAVEAVVGLAAETCLLLPFALAYLVWAARSGHAALSSDDTFLCAWLMLGGLVTAVPLALFAFGARRIPYSTVGLIQYLAPSLQFACGVFVLGEPFARTRLVGFGIIWLALALFAAEGLLLPKAAPASL
ncbi:MAG: transporter [Myxococcaceae bacterium]|nr:transporter [Myxococcaceae bacterium]